jgi:hypothetical protein
MSRRDPHQPLDRSDGLAIDDRAIPLASVVERRAAIGADLRSHEMLQAGRFGLAHGLASVSLVPGLGAAFFSSLLRRCRGFDQPFRRRGGQPKGFLFCGSLLTPQLSLQPLDFLLEPVDPLLLGQAFPTVARV